MIGRTPAAALRPNGADGPAHPARLRYEIRDPSEALAAIHQETLVITRLADVAAQPVEWLWPGYLPAGMLCLLDGDPGVGKSTLTDDLAARASTGRPMPDDTGGGEPVGVVILSAEDDLARTVRPRLEAAGADLARIATVALRERDGGTRAPLITSDDLAMLEEAVHETHARLLIVDPLMAYLPDEVNANRDHDVHRALAALAALAERTGCAVVVVRHLRKSAAESPLYRGGGSIGIIAAARAAFLVARDPGDPDRRVLAPLKLNVAPEPPARSFRLVVDPDRAHPRIAWEGVSSLDAGALLVVPGDTNAGSAIGEAVDVLREILAPGPLPATRVRAEAREAGLSWITVRRAQERLGIRPRKVGRPGERQQWVWALPDAEDAHAAPKVLTAAGMTAFVPDEHLRVEDDYPASAWSEETGDG